MWFVCRGKGLDAVASRAADIAVMLRKQGARLTSADPRVLQWARDGVSDSVLLDAMTLAIDSRQREGSAQPIGSKYLDTIARDLFERASGRALLRAGGRRTRAPRKRAGALA